MRQSAPHDQQSTVVLTNGASGKAKLASERYS
jgi:hypothetical protein